MQMEPAFESLLLEGGVGEDVVRVLKEQKVLSLRVFRAMKEDHIVKLLQCSCMPVGGHALLWQLWETDTANSPPYNCVASKLMNAHAPVLRLI